MTPPPLPCSAETMRRCPGERAPIGHAVHLARLLTAYEPCRTCAHRDETEGLNAAQLRLVSRALQARLVDDPWKRESFAGDVATEVTPLVARRLARAFSCWLRDHGGVAGSPRVILGSDGRPRLAEQRVALVEGLRWAGCEVVDVQTVTAPVVRVSVGELDADGGLLLGNDSGAPRWASLSFWGPQGHPLSTPGQLAELQRLYESEPTRPVRTSPSVQCFDASRSYLDRLRELCHGLRPLRFVLATSCDPLRGWLARLLADTACQATASKPANLAHALVSERAHFAVSIDGLGERIEVFDERGAQIEFARLASLMGEGCATGTEADALEYLLRLLATLSRSDTPLSALPAGPRGLP